MAGERTSLARGGARGAHDAAQASVVALCERGLDAVAFRRELRARLRRVVPFDAYCANTCDPLTLAITSSVGDGLEPPDAQRLFAIESAEDDVNKLAALAAGPRRVATVHDATGGEPARSRRMREVFLPLGFRDELRAALVCDGVCWGYLHLLRAAGRPFDRDELRAVGRAAPWIARALRRAATLGAAHARSDGAALVAFTPRGAVASCSAATERYFRELDHDGHQPVPHVVRYIAERTRAGRAAGEEPTAHAMTRAGAWLRVAGFSVGEGTVVVLDDARPAHLLATLCAAHRLSPRERAVVEQILAGRTNDEIAARLAIGTHTVKDHAKALFAKLRVQGRGELVAKLTGARTPREG